jgi:tetratricopeptide (TPR) repeat protein
MFSNYSRSNYYSLLPAAFVHAKEQVANDVIMYNKGQAPDQLGNYTGAIQYFDKALAIDPNDGTAGVFLILILTTVLPLRVRKVYVAS